MIQLLKEAKRHYEQLAPHVKSRETAKLLKALIDALDNQWQPIETYKNKIDGEILAIYKDSFGNQTVVSGYFNHGEFYQMVGEQIDISDCLTHWQPLPQPPKEKQ